MTTARPDAQLAAEERRERIRALMDRFEAAMAEPASLSPDDWRSRLSDLADEMSRELASHVQGTEGADGLFDDVMAKAPRLRSDVDRLRREHTELQTLLDRFRDVVVDDDPVLVRERGLALLTALIVHRQHGADVLYEAYWVDVGGLSG